MVNGMKGWKITGLIATLVIVLSIPAYLLKVKYTCKPADTKPVATFVGADKCRECHKHEYEKWRGSHHDKAMDMATEESVLGDFNNSVFEYSGIKSRFYRKNEKFYVYTRGPKGEMGDFEITHTFGCYPLQQYLVPFPGGRLQCLPIAWNVKEKKWYHLYPDEPLDPADWLYWTNAGLNWNGMCAECHSTNLKKNYDPKTDTYETTWSEIDVSCEACHGPGSLHVKWAEAPEMVRTATDNYGLVVKTSGVTSQQQVELCAPCHSRRMSLGDNAHDIKNLLNYGVPQLLSPGMYFSDGQIIEEVYVYASFVQSKMYDRDVRCNDCHDVHSVKRIKQGNQLCLQCHRADIYDTKTHHFHKKKTPRPTISTRRKEKKGNPSDPATAKSCSTSARALSVNSATYPADITWESTIDPITASGCPGLTSARPWVSPTPATGATSINQTDGRPNTSRNGMGVNTSPIMEPSLTRDAGLYRKHKRI